MTLIATILFLTLFPIQSEPEKVALVFGPEPEQIVLMDRYQAEVRFTELQAKQIRLGPDAEEKKVFAALVWALGTLPDRERLTAPPVNTRERLDWEIRRGVRKPLQKPELKQ
jgi:hypothetical protein